MVGRATVLLCVFIVFPAGSSRREIDSNSGVGGERATSVPHSPAGGSDSKPEASMSSSDIAQRLSQAHFEFTLKLYPALVQAGDQRGNMAFSPLLVSTLLTPTLLSAKGYAHVLSAKSKRASRPTLSQEEGLHRGAAFVSPQETTIQKMFLVVQQIQRVLNFHDLSFSAIEAWHKATVASLQDKYYKRFLKAPRGFLILQKRELTKELDRTLRKWFGHTLRKFQEPLSSSRVLHEINGWAENKTGNKIRDFLQENLLRDKRSLILSPGAIHSLWLNDFDPNNTFQKGLFYRTPDDRFEIPMMINRLELPLGYSQALEARVLELPFQRRPASLFVLLPDHLESGLNTLEANLTSENVRALLSTLKVQVVNLRIPRFYIDTTLSLVKALKMLGVKDLFRNGEANRWHSAENSEGLQLDDFIHRIRFEVRESSEEKRSSSSLSASNRFSTGTRSRMSETVSKFGEKYFEVDHPFIFFLWDYIASTIICMGRVADPRTSAAHPAKAEVPSFRSGNHDGSSRVKRGMTMTTLQRDINTGASSSRSFLRHSSNDFSQLARQRSAHFQIFPK